MSDQECFPQDLFRLRRRAYEFMRRSAVLAWEFQVGGLRWEITVPPEVEKLPERRRYRVHARQEAQRLAGAQMFDLCPRLSKRAVSLGSAIREGRHEEAVATAGRPNVVETLAIQPPAETGFLRWRDPTGIATNDRGAPVIACHWGPVAAGGQWIVWWSDTHQVARSYAAETDADADGVKPQELAVGILSNFGPLWYDCQELLHPYNAAAPEPEHAGADVGGDERVSTIGLVYTTLATWWLLSTPDIAIELTLQPPPAVEHAADRTAGLQARPITHATAAGVP